MSNSDNSNVIGEAGESIATASSVDTTSDGAEILVVVSKVKKLIKAKAGLNTGQCAIDALTRKVVTEVERGIENARKAGRKTVMGRDIQ